MGVQESLYLLKNWGYGDYLDEVYEAYKEPHRKYHTLDHIRSILGKIRTFQRIYNLDNDQVVALHVIAWYHDVVYVPGAKDNEEKSAELYWKHTHSNGLSRWDIYNAIVDTRTHLNPSSWLSAIFMDLDLGDIGTGQYWENRNLVREEFAEFDDEQWIEGHRKFLWTYSKPQREFLYHTSLGAAQWESQAQFNFRTELAQLEIQ